MIGAHASSGLLSMMSVFLSSLLVSLLYDLQTPLIPPETTPSQLLCSDWRTHRTRFFPRLKRLWHCFSIHVLWAMCDSVTVCDVCRIIVILRLKLQVQSHSILKMYVPCKSSALFPCVQFVLVMLLPSALTDWC